VRECLACLVVVGGEGEDEIALRGHVDIDMRATACWQLSYGTIGCWVTER
jgi:hypothetical protein